jgi:hypothetical protein
MVDFPGVDQVAAFAPAEIDAVPVVAIESKAGDCQRLALRARLLHPVVAAAGIVLAVADLRDDAFQAEF